MRRQLTLVGLAVALAMAGCGHVVSSAPIVTADEAEFDPRLVGEWEDDEERTFVVARGDGNSYTITVSWTDEPAGETASFGANLGRLGGRTVLDVQPAFDMPDDYADWYIPVHRLLAVEVDEEHELRFLPLEADSVRSHLESGELPLSYSIEGHQPYMLILHEGTAELRAALDAYLGRPGVFMEEPYILQFVPPDEGEAEAGHEG